MENSNEFIGLDYEYALNAQFKERKLIRVLPDYYADVRKYFITIPERNLDVNKQKVFDFLVDAISACMVTKN